MGESLISRGGNVNGYLRALVKVNTIVGTTITCTCGSTTRRKTATEEVVEFRLDYGTWTISAEIEGKTYSKTLVIEILQVYEIKLKGYNTLFGIAIDMDESDPEAAVTYTDDAVGFTPLTNSNYGSWTDLIKEFFGCRPCLYNGSVVGYLNPNDYTKFEDGSAADITNGSSGNVMVEFKKLYYKYAKDGNILTFKVTDDESALDNGYTCAAFKSMDGTGAVKDYMYYGAYEGCNIGYKLRSLSGKTPTGSTSYTVIRTHCQNNGSSFGMEDWCKRFYILGLLMLVTKTRGIQDVIGKGIHKDNVGSKTNTGTMNTSGLFAGGSGMGVKAFGIENLWGNMFNWCDGVVTLSSTTLGFKDCAPYNNTGSGYTSVADGYTREYGLYPTSMIPVMDGAAITASVGQSDNTLGWCDYWYVDSNSGRVALVGGSFDSSSAYVGPFCAYIYSKPSGGNAGCCGRVVAA